MHTNHLDNVELTLFRLNETPRTFSGYRHLLNDVGYFTLQKSLAFSLSLRKLDKFVVRNADGRPLSLHDFGPYFVGPYDDYRTVLFDIRRGPVEGIGRPGGGHYFRRMATFAERRDNGAWLKEEGEPRPRASRVGHNLPSPWDDYARDDWNAKNWKHYRKTQYKK